MKTGENTPKLGIWEIEENYFTTYILRLRHDCEFDGIVAPRGMRVKTINISGGSEFPEYLVEAFSGTRLVAQKRVPDWMVEPVELLTPLRYHSLGLRYCRY